MRPAILATASRRGEAPFLDKAFRGGFEQRHDAVFRFFTTIEAAVRGGDRAFVELALLLPDRLARLEILAGPAFAVRVAVEVIAQFHDAAMMIHHDLVGID